MWDIVGLIITVTLCIAVLGAGVVLAYSYLLREVNIRTAEVAGLTRDLVYEVSKSTRDSAVVVIERVVGTVLGKPGEPVPQAKGIETEEIPDWVHWGEPEDGDDDGLGSGIGDSVWIEDRRQGAVILEPGEGIIPGVPLPDMTGEDLIVRGNGS